MKSRRDHEDSDKSHKSVRSIHQIEVSHGSTSNQTSMYASTTTGGANTCTFCCDLIFIAFIFSISLFVMLFWHDHIPKLSTYFEHKKHRETKIVILSISVTIVIMLFIVFIMRCIRRSRYSSCYRMTDTVLFNRHDDKGCSPATSISDDELSAERRDSYHYPKQPNITSKLRELSEAELCDIRRILRDFMNYHDSNDWTLSPSSSRSCVLGGSPVNSIDNVKLKFTIKIVLVGSANVGKTSIFHRILYDRFTEYYMATLGVDLGHTTLNLFPRELNNHLMMSLQLWDIAGSERFSDLMHIVYKDSNAFIVVCDVTNSKYPSVALPWIKDIETLVFDPYIALFCNKIDLEQTMATASELDAELLRYASHSVSAKTGEKVLENVVEVVVNAVLHEVDKLL